MGAGLAIRLLLHDTEEGLKEFGVEAFVLQILCHLVKEQIRIVRGAKNGQGEDVDGVDRRRCSLSLSLFPRNRKHDQRQDGVILLMPALPSAVHKKGSFGVDFRPTTFGSSTQKNRFRIRE